VSSGPQKVFSDFLKPENILCRLTAEGWEDAIDQLATLLCENENGFSKDTVVQACIERERAASTVLTPRFALPHARVDGLERILVAVGVTVEGIMFADPARGAVNVIVLILTPTASPGLYLEVLASLTRELKDPGAAGQLAGCTAARNVYEFFAKNTVQLPPYLKARDLVEPNPVTLLESDSLKTVIYTFSSKHVLDIPVVDNDGDLRGAIALEDLLRLSLPEHLLWMHDLSSILHFEPFADLLRHDRDTKVADFMKDEYVSVAADMPAIQLAKMFVTENVRQILVVKASKLIGTVDIDAFVPKLLWV